MLPLIFSLLVTILSFHTGECKLSTPLAPALYAFGDSQIDPGNNNYIPTSDLARADYSPYGVDFINSEPTGRVSNGKTVVDLIAEYMGLPLPPPSLKPNSSISPSGYNYASAGCGILATTGNLFPILTKCQAHGRQIDQFESALKNELSSIYSPNQLEQHLADSLFFVWIGSNDYILSYFQIKQGSPEYYAQFLTNTLSAQLKRLINLGARKFVVFEIGPLGCIPYFVKEDGSCDATKNEIAGIYNTKLSDMITSLKNDYPSATFSLGRINALSKDAFDNPAKYGLTTVNKPCCERAVADGKTLVQCTKDGPVCGNRDEYLFFDAAHPTQAAYSVLSTQCINNASVCSPTIAELVGGSSSLQTDQIISHLHSSV